MRVCLNGTFLDSADARISVFDHGLLYGDGVFDTTAAVNGTIYWLEEHVARLLDGCARLRIPSRWSCNTLIDLTTRLYRENGQPTARLRLTITRGEGGVPIYAAAACRPNLIIFTTPLDLPEDAMYARGLRLLVGTQPRVYPSVKSLNFLPSVLGFLDARASGGDDVLFVNAGHVLEGATFNVFALLDGTIVTPADGILPGVTRGKVIELARQEGYRVEERPLLLSELLDADEAFVVSTTKRIMPLAMIDGHVIGDRCPGHSSRHLLARFRDVYF
jgi:branched-chain amino acid aminotransferase